MDFEVFYYKFFSAFVAEFSAQVDAMNTAKNNGLPVEEQIILNDMGEWFDESLDDKAKSFDFFGFIGTANKSGQTNGRALAADYELEIDLFIPNPQIQNSTTLEINNFQRILKRYDQVLMNTSQNMWRKVAPGMDVQINVLSPINASLNNSSRAYKLLGINLKFTMVFN